MKICRIVKKVKINLEPFWGFDTYLILNIQILIVCLQLLSCDFKFNDLLQLNFSYMKYPSIFKLILFFYISLVPFLASSQDYILDENLNGQTIHTCSGTLYDSGGDTADYSNNSDYIVTICPNNENELIRIQFEYFDTEENYDVLTISHENGTTIAILDGDLNLDVHGYFESNIVDDPGGCLVLSFSSDGAYTRAGWMANISCFYPCQDFAINTDDNIDTFNICQNTPIEINCTSSFPNNNVYYNQTNENTEFTWSINNSIIASGLGLNSYSITPEQGLSSIIVSAVDTNGCMSNQISIPFKTSITPLFSGTNISPDTVNLNEDVLLQASITPVRWSNELITEVVGTTFLPDGSGAEYSTSLYFNNIETPEITSIYDIVSICVNMEHSFMGDLDISLECPNGSTLSLVEQAGGGTFLGEPVDNDNDMSPGVGYDYCWTPTTTNGAWSENTGGTLPAGEYEAEGSWSSLIGCPINGAWTINVTDNLSSDNGYIFSWGISFNPDIVQDSTHYTNSYDYDNSYWDGNNIVSSNNNSAIAQPNITGDIPYTFYATDDFGCTYDTTLSVHVVEETYATKLNQAPTLNITQNKNKINIWLQGEPTIVEILNIQGQALFTQKLNSGANSIKHKLPSGIYLIKTEYKTEKIIIP